VTDPAAEKLAQLLARTALADRAAFAQLYEATKAKLFGVSLRIVRERPLAEEVLQDSFINIWNHAADYAVAKSAPLTWMTAIVRNRALDWLRRPNLERGDEDYDLLVEAVADDAPGPDVILGASRDARALAECLKQLTGNQRQTIILAYSHGLSHGELAQHLKQPLGTVKTWIRRGLDRLKGCMDTNAPG